MSSGVAGDAHTGCEEAKVLADNGTVTGASEICHIIGVQFPCPARGKRALNLQSDPTNGKRRLTAGKDRHHAGVIG